MLSGEQDTVVPPQHMRQLWEIAQLRGAGKTGESGSSATEETRKDKFISFPEGNHRKCQRVKARRMMLIIDLQHPQGSSMDIGMELISF